MTARKPGLTGPDARAASDPGNEAPHDPSWRGDGPLRRLISNASMLIGGRSMNGLLNLAAMTLIVRGVGLETFGSLALVHAFASAVGDVAKFQSWQAVLRYGTAALESDRILDFRRLIKLTVLLDLASSVVGIGVAVLVAPLLAARFDWAPDTQSAVQLYSVSILFMVTATPTGLLRLFDRFDLLSISNAIGSVVRVLGALWAFAFGADLAFLLGVWFCATVVDGVWVIGHSIHQLDTRGLLRGPRLGTRGLTSGHEGIASFVVTTQLNTTISAGMRRFSTVAVGLLVDTTAAGLFDLARQVTTLLTRLTQLMKPAIYPEFARLSTRADLAGIRRLMLRSMALMTGLGAAVVLPFVLFGRSLLGFFFGKEVEAAYGLTVLLASASAIRLLCFPLEPALISTGRAGTALVIRAASVFVFLGGLFVLIPRIGLIGAGLAMLAAAVVLVSGQSLAVIKWFRSQTAAAKTASARGDLRGEAQAPGS